MFSFLNISVTLPTFHPLCIVTMSIVYVNLKKKMFTHSSNYLDREIHVYLSAKVILTASVLSLEI